MKPEITRECVVPVAETRFVKLYDLQYAPGRHYYNATRREADNIIAVKSDGELKSSLPDAVTCFVIVRTPEEEPKLVLIREYRYPAGRVLCGPPAGLIDKKDIDTHAAILNAAKREIFEETGIDLRASDKLFTINSFLFSTPGMTDESNAIVCAVADLPDYSSLNQSGAEGTEYFEGFALLTAEEAADWVRLGRDDKGLPYSAYTWMALCYFISGAWQG